MTLDLDLGLMRLKQHKAGEIPQQCLAMVEPWLLVPGTLRRNATTSKRAPLARSAVLAACSARDARYVFGPHSTFARFWAKVFLKLALDVLKGLGIVRVRLFRRNVWPVARKLAVDFEPLLKSWLRVGLDGVDRTFGLAHAAINTLIGVDDEHIGAFVEAVDWTDFDAIGELALDAVFSDDEGHRAALDPSGARLSRGRGRCACLGDHLHA